MASIEQLMMVAGAAGVGQLPTAETTFPVFEVNGPGRISVAELATMIQQVGSSHCAAPAATLLAAADSDGDGFLSPQEFAALLGSLGEPM